MESPVRPQELNALAWAFVAALVGCGTGGSTGGSEAGDSNPCDPGPSGPVSGLFNRQCLDFTSSGSSLYDHVQDRTTVGAEVPADAATGGSRFTLLVPGNSAGQFSCDQNPDGGLTIGMTFGEATATYSTTGLASITPCAITIDAYGAVGGQVTGTFSGTLVATSRVGNPLPPAQVVVTQGTFAVTRMPDQ